MKCYFKHILFLTCFNKMTQTILFCSWICYNNSDICLHLLPLSFQHIHVHSLKDCFTLIINFLQTLYLKPYFSTLPSSKVQQIMFRWQMRNWRYKFAWFFMRKQADKKCGSLRAALWGQAWFARQKLWQSMTIC